MSMWTIKLGWISTTGQSKDLKARTSAVQKTIFYKGLYLFNLLPNNIKNEGNFVLFKKM